MITTTSPNNPLTLGNVLFADARGLSEHLGRGLDGGDESRGIKAALVTAAPGLPLAALLDGIAGAVGEMLDVPVTDVLVGAWSRARDLRAALQTTRESPDTSVLVPLLRHTITSEHRPYVDVMKGEVPIARLAFTLTVEGRLEGVTLRVRQGRVVEILSGTVRLKVTLRLGAAVLVEKALAPIAIPGVVAVARAAA